MRLRQTEGFAGTETKRGKEIQWDTECEMAIVQLSGGVTVADQLL